MLKKEYLKKTQKRKKIVDRFYLNWKKEHKKKIERILMQEEEVFYGNLEE